MEVAIPVQEIHFNGKTTAPYMSSSSNPKRFTRDLHRHHSTAAAGVSGSSPAPVTEDEEDDFAFDFCGHLDKNAPPPEITTADELFYEGKIRPLKLPLCLRSPEAARRTDAKISDPFSASMDESTRDSRGRNRAPSLSSRSRKGSRSLSPLRNEIQPNNLPPISYKTEEENSVSSKKWRSFKDLLLFRSASEGQATGDRNKDPLRKYTAACLSPRGKKGGGGDESRSSSFRCASPHEMHYAANRAAAEEMKRKTALPYKDSFFMNWLFHAPALRGLGGSAGREKSMGGFKSMPRLRN